MKKITRLFLIFSLIILSDCKPKEETFTTTAAGRSVAEWETQDIDGGVRLTKYLGTATTIVVPESVGGKEVLEIGASIFGQSESKPNTSITGVDMSRATKIRAIGNNAFSYCRGLTSMTLPSGLTAIGYKAFSYCSSLTSITLPSGLTDIGRWAFYECSSLTRITLPSSVTTIGSSAFYGCSSLTSITIPNSVTSIGGWAFDGCSSLTSITIPNSVTSIEKLAFFNCSSLTSIMLPSGLTTIGDGAFEKCTALTLVTLQRSASPLTSITDDSFKETPLTSSITAAAIRYPSGAAYKTADGWKDLQATFEAQ